MWTDLKNFPFFFVFFPFGMTKELFDAGASTTYIGNSILIMENSDSGGCEILETPNMSSI